MRHSPTLRRTSAILCAAVAVLLAVPGLSRAEPADDRRLTVSGDVREARDLTGFELRAYPSRTEVVTFVTDAGPQTHIYQGTPLEALITASRPVVDDTARNPLLTIAVVATGADGYAATLAWADLSPALTRRPALVAWTQDGAELDAPRLVVPEDVSGARYVAGLTGLRVVALDPT